MTTCSNRARFRSRSSSTGSLRACLAAALLASACGEASTPRAPNLLLITIDTLRADRVGAYGDGAGATPAIDALAREGWRFDPAVTPVPLTLPAHATILTGLEPPHHGVRGNGAFALPQAHHTLAEILRARGYATAAFIGAFPLDARFGLDQGFDVYDDDVGGGRGDFHYAERPATEVVAAAIRWLDARGTTPYFAWVHLFDPHDPYEAEAAWAARFPGDPYRGEVAATDAAIATLFTSLRARGTWDDTSIVVTSDHGEALGDHGEQTHGFFIYESTTRVPLIVKPPARYRGPRRSGPARLADVMPTALTLLGLPVPAGLSGVALTSSTGTTEAYVETLMPQLDYNWSPLYGVRSTRWKYIHAPEPELYDLNADPHERRNVLVEQPAEATRLRGRLAVIAQSAGTGAASQARPDAETARKLESLGYAAGMSRQPADGGPDPKRMLPLALEIDAISRLDPEALPQTMAALRRLAQRDPRNNLIQRRLATACERAKNWACAADAYDRANTLGYDTPDLRQAGALAAARAAIAADEQGRTGGAGHYVAMARRLDPNPPEVGETYGVWLARNGRLREAAAALRDVSERHPERWPALWQLGLVEFRLGDIAAAAVALERAARLAPDNAEVRKALDAVRSAPASRRPR